MGTQSVGAMAVVVLVLTGVFAGSASAAASASSELDTSGNSSTISVAATNDYGYQPSPFEQVPTNTTITVTLTDDSDLPHTFTIIGKEGWVVPSSISASDFANLVYGHSPPVLFNLNVSGSGDVQSGSFGSPGPGWYEIVCTTPGHFQSGMYTFIAFGENLPPNLTQNSRVGVGGGSALAVEAAAGGAVVVAIVLGVVVWRRRRRGHPPTPESF